MDATGNSTLDAGFTGSGNIAITPEIEIFLHEIRKWAKFIAIFGFILCGLLVLLGLFFTTLMAAMPSGVGGLYAGGLGAAMSIIYIALAVVYFFPFLFLYRFAASMKTALEINDQHHLTTAFSNLKAHYKFVGILLIVLLGFYALMIIGGIGAGLMAAF